MDAETKAAAAREITLARVCMIVQRSHQHRLQNPLVGRLNPDQSAPREDCAPEAGNDAQKSDSEGKLMDTQQSLDLIPDFLGEDRHEFVEKLAYKLGEERGRPFGSPEVDWFAAEQAVYSSLLAAGLLPASADDPQRMAEKIYR
jgi:hypothetical protein